MSDNSDATTGGVSRPDALFSAPRLAQVYDLLDPDRSDLAAYTAILDELGARTVLDLGCGTGTLALMLAAGGRTVIGVDPADASLDVARAKPGAGAVTWVHAGGAALPSVEVDAVTMTGNVAQVFVTDEQWAAVLGEVHRVLRPGGHLVFETRDPAAETWRTWTRSATRRSAALPDGGMVECWEDLTQVALPLVSFRTTFVFSPDGAVLTSDSTLRFRTEAEVRASLRAAGFGEARVRDAPDRPGRELVFIAPA